MSNTDDPRNDEEQSPTIPTDYRALVAMTRPLVIAEHTMPSWRGGEICRSGFRTPLEPEDRRAEFTLGRGEILGPDKSELGTTRDKGLATGEEEAGTSSAPEVEDAAAESASALRRRDSNLQIRIYLGMS